ncbi:MAG: hypothetical protein GY943_26290, partial [Chloroflexi bacterium]|nr:hypothetical protein [Chloroflexota bacterium]
MILDGLTWAWNKFRPAEGWLSILLLCTAIGTVIYAVLEVGWVPEDEVVVPTAICGLFLGMVLAKRPLHTAGAWLLITLYSFAITTIDLANLWTSPFLLFSNTVSVPQIWRQNSALFFDRMASWFKAVFSGGSSQETIVFAFALGFITFLLSAYAGWSTFRQRKPLLGLTMMGLALALNGYFGGAEIYWIGFFVGIAALLTAALHFANLERDWTINQVDYSDEVRWELLAYAGIIAAFLLTVAMVLPGIEYRKIARWFQSTTAVQTAEGALGRAFGGVQQPRGESLSPGGVGGSGILPRSYLIGNAPELSENVMMRATVNVIDKAGNETVAPTSLIQGSHWRALSYDVYTGRGWALSEERTEDTPASQPIPLPAITNEITLSQSVDWIWDDRIIRYTVGLPLSFDQDISVSWRGLEDLSRVQGEGASYQVQTRLPRATLSDLRDTAVQNIPPTILARYSTLAPSVPNRVHELAQEIAGDLDNPYDQARAIEQFLRQYTYSLDVPIPPEDVDPVDYFLFDLQAGYCDYYASSMVVLARSLGLPARIAVGFLSQQPDENGVQTIYQINAHSWAEVYFAGYGWVEFEPTAPFQSPRDTAQGSNYPDYIYNPYESALSTDTVPSIPEAQPQSGIPWTRLAWILLLVPLVWYWQRRQEQQNRSTTVVWAYGRLQHHAQRLGYPTLSHQTPYEFMLALQQRLDQLATRKWLHTLVTQIQKPIATLTHLFAEAQYSERKAGKSEVATTTWQALNRPLWFIRFAKRILRLDKKTAQN